MKKSRKVNLFYSDFKVEGAIGFTIGKLACVILAIFLILSSFNLNCLSPVFASNEELIESTLSDADYSSVENLEEIKSMRTKDSKTYKKVNDSYELVMYGEDVHYMDNGEYREIDNELSLDGISIRMEVIDLV